MGLVIKEVTDLLAGGDTGDERLNNNRNLEHTYHLL